MVFFMGGGVGKYGRGGRSDGCVGIDTSVGCDM